MAGGIAPFGTIAGSLNAACNASRSPLRNASSIRRNSLAWAQRSSSVATPLILDAPLANCRCTL